MRRTLNGKTVLITGASSGIGAACATVFYARGANVVLSARKTDALQEVVRSMDPDRVLCVRADVQQQADCEQLINAALERFGSLDVLINNAGISMRALFRETDLAVLRQLMETNFWGSVYCTHYALPALLRSKGSIVGVSSIAGYRGLPGRTGYSASKFALQGFLEALRTEHLYDGLQVLVVCPGFTATNIRNTALNAKGTAQGESPREEEKMMSAEEVADAMAQAVEHNARTLILTRQGKLTVWLNKFFPSWMDGMVYRHLAKEPDSPFGQRKY